MPIREQSFRIGSGRYLQDAGIIKACADEIARFGKSALVVGGKTALSVAGDSIKSSLEASGLKYKIITHLASCNEDDAKQLASLCKGEGYDTVVGVGGGVIMDFAKLVAFFASAPVINIPTSSATCACFTPLSVCYTKDGRTVGTKHFEYEVDCVIVDTQIVASQPPRLFLSGVFDALAKYIEIKQRYNEDDYALGLDWAYALSQRSFFELSKKTESALSDMKKGEVTKTVEQVIFASLAATGVISGIARGSNQCALAHKFYENARACYFENCRPYLHGEIVGVGLLLQNIFNNEDKENDFLLSVMKKHGMPSSVYDIGLTDEARHIFYEKLINTSAIDKNNAAETEKLSYSLERLWRIK